MIDPSGTAGASTLTNSIQWDSSWPEWVESSERHQLLDHLWKRFGIPRSAFANYHLLRRGSTLWLLTKNERLPALASLRVEEVGVPLLRRVKTHLKPTSAALQLLGRYATKNIISLKPIELKKLVEKESIEAEFPVSPGYVILLTEGVIVGCGLYVPGRLRSQFPRHLFTGQTWDHWRMNTKD